jgi:hypothetical protein
VNKRYLLLPCLLIVSALALAACGSSGSNDEGEIEEAIETSATSTDPADCKKLSTQAFMEQSTSTSGAEAVEECEEEASDPKDIAESVAVTNVEVEGEEATADAAFTGGSFDGQTVELALVKEDDQWKLNEVEGFAKLDQPALVEALEVQFEEGESELSEETTTCILEGFEEASQPEIEELLLSGSSEPIEELAEECS